MSNRKAKSRHRAVARYGSWGERHSRGARVLWGSLFFCGHSGYEDIFHVCPKQGTGFESVVRREIIFGCKCTDESYCNCKDVLFSGRDGIKCGLCGEQFPPMDGLKMLIKMRKFKVQK